jgi:hypothetical protein
MRLSEELRRALVEDVGKGLEDRIEGLLHSYDEAKAREAADWMQAHFRINVSRTPRGQKALKRDAEWLHRHLAIAPDPETMVRLNPTINIGDYINRWQKEMERRWSPLKAKLPDLVRHFSDEGKGSDVPAEIKVGTTTYVNKVGWRSKKLRQFAQDLEKLWASLKGWRRKALKGGLKVVLAGPREFRGTSSGTYRRAEDALYVRATPKRMKWAGAGAYASPAYILVHELGHRYEAKNSVPTALKMGSWTTTRYSHTEDEHFAELFALGHFGITGAWKPETQERFETLMKGGR